jgi:hypothetical protein
MFLPYYPVSWYSSLNEQIDINIIMPLIPAASWPSGKNATSDGSVCLLLNSADGL